MIDSRTGYEPEFYETHPWLSGFTTGLFLAVLFYIVVLL